MLARSLVFMIGSLIFSVTAAFAGQQFVDKSGYAVSGYDVVEYRNIKQSSLIQLPPKAVAGKNSITAEYNGAKWAFATKQNRAVFLANPKKYVPAYDGHCAYGLAQGGKVPGNPHIWRIVDDKLYLNITATVSSFWNKDIPGFISQADARWKTLELKPASNNTAPDFDHTNAPK